ncbi:malonate decarboxylase holo-ACP synthase [Bacillus sp. FJAT-45350]|uniref:malonate decarboxylase holo-ACP synthase n=1 Tax=Bacillus sp. FJAT-45350 TaxID=2011014 RepID=UPI000BB7CAD8|nr:malonate decarboxylase holo-ACP synthase [Bacillus sp. FJAT-45350]
MALRPHDLLEINNHLDLFSYTAVPEWVAKSLNEAPFVVVRRASSPKGLVAVGVRGTTRSERFAAFLPMKRIVNQITPEKLANERSWKGIDKDLFETLERVAQIMQRYTLFWGPVGSSGFELASGKETVTKTSDIDIIIRPVENLSIDLAQKLEKEFFKLPIRIDTQVEILEGAFLLKEYATSEGKSVLFRTNEGPILKKPFQEEVIS